MDDAIALLEAAEAATAMSEALRLAGRSFDEITEMEYVDAVAPAAVAKPAVIIEGNKVTLIRVRAAR
jgi:hypothetical protein